MSASSICLKSFWLVHLWELFVLALWLAIGVIILAPAWIASQHKYAGKQAFTYTVYWVYIYISISIYLFLNHLTLINSSLLIKLPSVKVSNSPPDFVLSAFLGCGEEPSSKPWLFWFPLDVENRHKNKWETCIFNAIYCPLSEQYRASRWRLLRRLILGQPAKYSPPFKNGAKWNEKALIFFVTFFTIT